MFSLFGKLLDFVLGLSLLLLELFGLSSELSSCSVNHALVLTGLLYE